MAQITEDRVREILKADGIGIQMTEDRVREIVKAVVISDQDERVRKIVKAALATTKQLPRKTNKQRPPLFKKRAGKDLLTKVVKTVLPENKS